eukprot:5365794-Pleurochrysis_carterae.AAC.2
MRNGGRGRIRRFSGVDTRSGYSKRWGNGSTEEGGWKKRVAERGREGEVRRWKHAAVNVAQSGTSFTNFVQRSKRESEDVAQSE